MSSTPLLPSVEVIAQLHFVYADAGLAIERHKRRRPHAGDSPFDNKVKSAITDVTQDGRISPITLSTRAVASAASL